MSLKEYLKEIEPGKSVIGETEFLPSIVNGKTIEGTGSIRIYRDPKGEQLVVGRRYQPLPSHLFLLRPFNVYKLVTNIEVVKPFPENTFFYVTPIDDLIGVFSLVDPICKLEEGIISFLILSFRKFEIEIGCSIVKFKLFNPNMITDLTVERKRGRPKESE